MEKCYDEAKESSWPQWRRECCDRQLLLEVTKMERVNLSEEENVVTGNYL